MRNVSRVLIVFTAFAVLCPAMTWYVRASPKTVVIGNYSANTPPVINIKSGDTVDLETVSGSPAMLRRLGLTDQDIPAAALEIDRDVKERGPGGHILTGPIFIEGAEPGDTLEVHIEKVTLPVPWSYNSFRPTSGFLPEDFPKAASKLIPLDLKKRVALFAPGIEIPLRPFFGSMGVAPPADLGRLNSAPPWMHAGNLDNKDLVAG
ncbi:MAG TPA: acetamidase/formamidase family protein, partial [Bryobacteraceae bacterium]|nr:acetamidase/formamidase family protein [Bryobacteraceae bacterium]